MALPAGIVTKTLTVSTTASNDSNVRQSLEIVIESTGGTIVWAPTSQPVSSFFTMIRTGPDQSAVIQLPAVDQTGFVDENQNPITNWTYTIKVRYLRDGRKIGQSVTKYLRPLLSSPSVIDFDDQPTGDVPIYEGPPGPAGLSAYQVALKNGFVGSEIAWLQSLATGGVTPFFDYQQTVPSDTWEIEHNLGYHPGGITTVDSSGREFIGEVQYIDTNNVRITMVGATSGTAHLS